MKFEIVKDKSGDLRWRLIANNGQILANSGVSYASKDQILEILGNIKLYAQESPVFEQIEPENKDWRTEALNQLRKNSQIF